MSKTETLTFIRIREQGSGKAQNLKLDEGATFREALAECDFVTNPEEFEVCYYDKSGEMKSVGLDDVVEDHVYEQDQEFLTMAPEDVG